MDLPAFDTVIVGIGQNLEANILATVAAKSAGARHLISKADTGLTAGVLASAVPTRWCGPSTTWACGSRGSLPHPTSCTRSNWARTTVSWRSRSVAIDRAAVQRRARR